MTHDGILKPAISNRHFGQEVERIRVEDLKFARQRRCHEDAFSRTVKRLTVRLCGGLDRLEYLEIHVQLEEGPGSLHGDRIFVAQWRDLDSTRTDSVGL